MVGTFWKVSGIEQKRNMDLMDVIADRRAVRRFEDTSVDQLMIHTLLNAAVLAPSAMNRQP